MSMAPLASVTEYRGMSARTTSSATQHLATTTDVMLSRRSLFVAGIAAVSAATATPAGAGALSADWEDFRRRFVTSEGRVLDIANGNVSHSEGQGAGLLFAVRADDRATFDRVLAWTRHALRRPRDTLLAWRYRPNASTPVSDMNNASDGDLKVAWALAEAAERWDDRQYRALGTEMARDILRRVVLDHPDGVVLMPGCEGFMKPDHLIVNPSYYIPPAFRALARLAPGPHWRALEATGRVLTDQTRFGRWQLPADWVALPRAAGRALPATGWPARFSWDALRVPLYGAWSGHRDSVALRAAVNFWADPAHSAPPAWVDLRTDAVASYPGDTGLRAIQQLAVATLTGTRQNLMLPAVSAASNYYSAVLVMMSRLAWIDVGFGEPVAHATPRHAPSGGPTSHVASPRRSLAPWARVETRLQDLLERKPPFST